MIFWLCSGMRFQTSAGSVYGDCMKIAPPGTRPVERIAG